MEVDNFVLYKYNGLRAYETTEVTFLAEAEAEVDFSWPKPKPKFWPKFRNFSNKFIQNRPVTIFVNEMIINLYQSVLICTNLC